MTWSFYRGESWQIVKAADAAGVSAGPVDKHHLLSSRPYDGGVPRPETGGLRCERLFGPVRDFRCLCSKYSGQEHAGLSCEKCGVEVIDSKARSSRWAHADLGTAVLHPVDVPRVAALLSLAPDEVSQVARGEAWLERADGKFYVQPLAQDSTVADSQILDHHAAMGALALQDALPEHALHTVDRVWIPPPAERPLIQKGRAWVPGALDLKLEHLLARAERLRMLAKVNAPESVCAAERWRVQDAFDAVVAFVLGAPIVRAARQSDRWVRPEVGDDSQFEHSTRRTFCAWPGMANSSRSLPLASVVRASRFRGDRWAGYERGMRATWHSRTPG